MGRNSLKRNRKMSGGFTMIELIFVVAVMAVLFAGVVKMVTSQSDTIDVNKAISQINSDVATATAQYKKDYYLATEKYAVLNAEVLQAYLPNPSDYTLTGAGNASKLNHTKFPGYYFQVLPDIHNATNDLRYKIYFDGSEAKTTKVLSDQKAQQIESMVANYFQSLYPTASSQIAGGSTAIGAANTNVTASVIDNDLKIAVGKCGF
ncbi:MAG: type II secretion system protein [Sulfurimonas sp.]|uniref:type II secretion system protein n=1 Tax=Sulfurimonas sp. TaxID=2022749 RepID=UPI00260CF847|nr:type II secretion system protein [Sulfurimonas sp.]MDD5373325.1 type II secretion system protein [Sulfurimonas sp.]